MGKAKAVNSSDSSRRMRPALSPEALSYGCAPPYCASWSAPHALYGFHRPLQSSDLLQACTLYNPPWVSERETYSSLDCHFPVFPRNQAIAASRLSFASFDLTPTQALPFRDARQTHPFPSPRLIKRPVIHPSVHIATAVRVDKMPRVRFS